MKQRLHTSAVPVAWFRYSQRDDIYDYFEVHGDPGKTSESYVIAVRFSSDSPSITVEHNHKQHPSGLSGIWKELEAFESINEQQYREAFDRAMNHDQLRIDG